jgi:hypothetical protein
MAGMTKRDTGFLLIGLGVGHIFSVATIFYFALLFHELFLVLAWKPGLVILAVPFVLIFAGTVILIRDRFQRISN